jgi:hypothetical protein
MLAALTPRNHTASPLVFSNRVPSTLSGRSKSAEFVAAEIWTAPPTASATVSVQLKTSNAALPVDDEFFKWLRQKYLWPSEFAKV